MAIVERRRNAGVQIFTVRKRGLTALLKTMKPLEEPFPEIDDLG
jgi:hypothetical protein